MVVHICNICNKEFNRKSNYTYHINNTKCSIKCVNNTKNVSDITKNVDIKHKCKYCRKNY